MREEIEKRTLRTLINAGIIFLLILALSFLNINLTSITSIIPSSGFSLTAAVALIAVIVLFLVALRTTLDLIKLVDLASETFLRHMPGFNPEKSPSIVRALKEVLIILIISVAVSAASPIISSIPNIGGWLSLGISAAAFLFAAILAYDSGKTIYAAFESSIQVLIDRLISHSNSYRRGEKTDGKDAD